MASRQRQRPRSEAHLICHATGALLREPTPRAGGVADRTATERRDRAGGSGSDPRLLLPHLQRGRRSELAGNGPYGFKEPDRSADHPDVNVWLSTGEGHGMRYPPTRRRALALAIAWASFLALGALPVGAATADGMLEPDDTGLTVVAKPHRSTVIAVDSVDTDCTPTDGVERGARVVSFTEKPENRASGAQLNQVVYDFRSTGAAKAFFAEVRANEVRRAKCSATKKAADLELTKGPAGVGDARFTLTSNETVNGAKRRVVSVEILAGSTIIDLIFVDWDKGLPSTTAVATAAAKRLSD